MRTVLGIVAAVCALGPVIALAQDSQERIRRTQRVIVSSLDPALPDVPLDAWLRQVVGSSARFEWTSGSCAVQRDPDDPAVPLCGIVAAANGDVTVTVGVRLGEYVQGTKVDRWETPRLDEAFIHRRDLVMLDRLGDLPRILTLAGRWPTSRVVLESVRCLPKRALPGEGVTCSMSLVNNGGAPSLARVFVDARPERRRGSDGIVKLLVGARSTVRMMFPWAR